MRRQLQSDVNNVVKGAQGLNEKEEGGGRKSGWEREIPFREISSGVAE